MVDKMKKCFLFLLVMVMLAIPIVSNADAIIEEFWELSYEVDYDVEVTAPDGGVNLRWGAGEEYDKVIPKIISNGTKLHIERETKAENGKLWGYTIVGNNGGWVFLGHCSKISQVNPEVNVTSEPEITDNDPQPSDNSVDSEQQDNKETPKDDINLINNDDADADADAVSQPLAKTDSNMTTMIIVIIAIIILAIIITAFVLLRKNNKK